MKRVYAYIFYLLCNIKTDCICIGSLMARTVLCLSGNIPYRTASCSTTVHYGKKKNGDERKANVSSFKYSKDVLNRITKETNYKTITYHSNVII